MVSRFLLISLFAGFVSLHCKRYLKVGGLLLVAEELERDSA